MRFVIFLVATMLFAGCGDDQNANNAENAKNANNANNTNNVNNSNNTNNSDVCGDSCGSREICVEVDGVPTCECDLGSVRDVLSCVPAMCSAENPEGTCLVGGQTCEDGRCVSEPTCTAATPNGECPGDYSCVEGRCMAASGPCSEANPTGSCAYVGQVCEAGQCTTPRCSPENLNGSCSIGDCVNGECMLITMCGRDAPNGTCSQFKRYNQVCKNGSCESASFDECWQCNPGYACISDRSSVCEPLNNVCSSDSPQGACPTGYACDGIGCVDSGDRSLCAIYSGVSGEFCPEDCDDATCADGFSCEDTLNDAFGKVCLPARKSLGEACESACETGTTCSDGTCAQNCSDSSDTCLQEGQFCYDLADGWVCHEEIKATVGESCESMNCEHGSACGRHFDGEEKRCFETCESASDACTDTEQACANLFEGPLACAPDKVDFGGTCDPTNNKCREGSGCGELSSGGSECMELCPEDRVCLQAGFVCLDTGGAEICWPGPNEIGEPCARGGCVAGGTCLSFGDEEAQCYEECDGAPESPCQVEGYVCGMLSNGDGLCWEP